MNVLINIGIVIATFCAMEGVAWLAHKYLMHGLLWSWHKDHHDPDLKDGFFEKNDLFFVVFALPSMLCYLLGSFVPDLSFLFYIGIGISIYGMVYFLIHDVYIHKRFKWFKHLDSPYSRAILRAHGAHHVSKVKEEGESFGLLFVHRKYFGKRKDWQKTN
jgi:beta-carotene 3-hydroxylase